MFAELRKLHGSGAIRGYYNVWACLHAPAAESECLQDPIDIFSHRVYTVYSLKMITRVRVDAPLFLVVVTTAHISKGGPTCPNERTTKTEPKNC